MSDEHRSEDIEETEDATESEESAEVEETEEESADDAEVSETKEEPEAEPEVTEPPEVRAGNFVTGLMEHAGFEVSVDVERDDDGITIRLNGEDANALVVKSNGTKSPDALDAIASLARRVASSRNQREVPVVVDANGYRLERVEKLATVADAIGKKVDAGLHLHVYGMDSIDRRAVHRHLADGGNVNTESVGFGLFRHLTVSAAKS